MFEIVAKNINNNRVSERDKLKFIEVFVNSESEENIYKLIDLDLLDKINLNFYIEYLINKEYYNHEKIIDHFKKLKRIKSPKDIYKYTYSRNPGQKIFNILCNEDSSFFKELHVSELKELNKINIQVLNIDKKTNYRFIRFIVNIINNKDTKIDSQREFDCFFIQLLEKMFNGFANDSYVLKNNIEKIIKAFNLQDYLVNFDLDKIKHKQGLFSNYMTLISRAIIFEEITLTKEKLKNIYDINKTFQLNGFNNFLDLSNLTQIGNNDYLLESFFIEDLNNHCFDNFEIFIEENYKSKKVIDIFNMLIEKRITIHNPRRELIEKSNFKMSKDFDLLQLKRSYKNILDLLNKEDYYSLYFYIECNGKRSEIIEYLDKHKNTVFNEKIRITESGKELLFLTFLN
tara:strand:+ start:135641 stop:136843 length:1203 start_codon:yes stop_codon:yes gene_type:complete